MLSLVFCLSLVVLMAGGFFPVVAQECFPENAAFFFDTEVEYKNLTQQKCATLVGSAYFGSKFTKNLVVPKITNVSQELSLDGNDVVESIEFPDLEYVHSLYAEGFSRLSRVSMPKVRHVHTISFEVESPEITVDLPSLEKVDGQLRMIGNWTSLDFPKLCEVNDTASLCQDSYCLGGPGKRPMDISLPQLEQVNERLEVGGNIASFSVPALAKIGAHHFGTEFGGFLSIDNFGEPLNVSLPQLTAANGATIRGNLTDVNVPLLQDELEGIQVVAENPLSLNFPFEDGRDIVIMGPIDSVHFPKMKNFTSLWVNSDKPFDCGALKKEIEKTVGDIGERTFLCSGKDVPGLSTGAKAGIGTGVAAVGVLVIALGIFMWRRIGRRNKGTLHWSPN